MSLILLHRTPLRTCTRRVNGMMIFIGISRSTSNRLPHVTGSMLTHSKVTIHLVRSLFPLAFGSALHRHQPSASFHQFRAQGFRNLLVSFPNAGARVELLSIEGKNERGGRREESHRESQGERDICKDNIDSNSTR